MSDKPPVPDANEFWTPWRFLLILSAVVLALFPKVALGFTFSLRSDVVLPSDIAPGKEKRLTGLRTVTILRA